MNTRTKLLTSLLDDTGKIKPEYFSISLTDFDDIDLSSQPTENKILRYNSSTGTFVPGEPIDFDPQNLVLETQVDSDLQDIIGVSPETLDTLVEIENTLDSVSTVETIKARVAGYKCEVFDGDGTTKIFSTRTHKAGYTSVTVNGLEMIDRVASTSDTTSANRLTSGYDFYSGTGTSAYQVVAEYQDTGTPLLFAAIYWVAPGNYTYYIWIVRYGRYPYSDPYNWDIGGLVPAGIRNEGYVGARSAVGDIFKIDDDNGDIIFRTGNQARTYGGGYMWNTKDSGTIPIYSRGGVVPSGTPSGEVSPFTVADPYFYKLQSITAPNPSHAQESSDKIYFLTAPPNGSKIVVRYYE